MNQKRKVLITFLVLIVIVAGGWLITKAITSYTGYSITEVEDLEEFSSCIGEKAELYTTATCPHCKAQKDLFKIYVGNLNIIDCTENPDICVEKEVRFVPTWIINGEKYIGEKSLEKLSELTGCELNK